MTTLLSYEEYKSTLTVTMIDVTQTAESLLDIWPYVKKLTENNTVNKYDNNPVETVYRNDINTFDHVLRSTSDKNIFIVIVVDILNKKIKGHFYFNLCVEYGLIKPFV